MKKLFVNDPFARVYEIFRQLYPDKDCCCFWTDALDDAYGVTLFSDNSRMPPKVFVSVDLPVKNAVEILAHELAHVAVGLDAGHGEAWENAFEAIHRTYCRTTSKEECSSYEVG